MSEFISVEGFDRSNWEEGTDAYPKDSLNRRELAEFYTSFLVGKGVSSSTGYVLNIDSGWGTGKTYFLQQWRKSIEKNYPTIYIDAWKQDYSDDPIITIFASIMNQLSSLDRNQTTKAKAIISSVASFSKAAGPVLLKGLIKKATGINTDEITDKISKNDGDGVLADAAGAIAQSLIADHNNKLVAIDELRESIASLVESVVSYDDNLNRPAFIFVDELDRCRPSYAVELLEVIKHFFATKGVVFVVATDTHQLQHTIKGLYGTGFDAEIYLTRFFNRRAMLNPPDREVFIKRLFLADEDISNTFDKVHFPFITGVDNLSFLVASFASPLKLSLREIEQLCDQVKSVLWLNINGFDLFLFLYVYVLYRWYPEKYRLFKENDANYLADRDSHDEKDASLTALIGNKYGYGCRDKLKPFGFISDMIKRDVSTVKMPFIIVAPNSHGSTENISFYELISNYLNRTGTTDDKFRKFDPKENKLLRDLINLNASIGVEMLPKYFSLIETSALLTQI